MLKIQCRKENWFVIVGCVNGGGVHFGNGASAYTRAFFFINFDFIPLFFNLTFIEKPNFVRCAFGHEISINSTPDSLLLADSDDMTPNYFQLLHLLQKERRKAS